MTTPNPEDRRLSFGYHKGERLGDLKDPELRSLRDWCAEREGFESLISDIETVLEDREGLPLDLELGPRTRRRQ